MARLARKHRLTASGLVLAVAVAAGGLVFFHWFGPEVSLGHEQPIAFSHRVHVINKRIDCYYCHPYPERSLNAGLPSVRKCMGCHEYIIPKHPQIQKLHGYWERGEPLDWVRVYYNPEHVYFPHYRHLGQGVECAECHGAVEHMDRLATRTFYMGFCLDCHHRREANRECTACHQ